MSNPKYFFSIFYFHLKLYLLLYLEQGGNLPSNTIFIKMHQMGFVQRMVNHYVEETKQTLNEFKEDFGPFFQTLIDTTTATDAKERSV
jgi:hypothetical protein